MWLPIYACPFFLLSIIIIIIITLKTNYHFLIINKTLFYYHEIRSKVFCGLVFPSLLGDVVVME